MLLEVITFSALVSGVVTGCLTLSRHGHQFQDFRIADVISLRIDSLLYLLLQVSTAFCLIDIAIRAVCLTDPAAMADGVKWNWLFGFQDIRTGLLASGVHLLIDRLLDTDGFCKLCRSQLSLTRGRTDAK